ncbi:hypothetical protein JZ751_025915, partial [Albula glossodonta]
MKENKLWHRPLIIFITVLIVVGIIALVTTAVVQNKALPKKYKYGIVLDAGSSHTAVYIYEWPAEKENNTGMVRQTHSCNVKGKGISSYAARVKEAGMKENKTQSEQVLLSVADFLRGYPSSFSDVVRLQERSTMGALDLGGASTQITFVSQQRVESPENSLHFRLYGNDYQTGDSHLSDPCFHPGYRQEKSVDRVFGSPCVSTSLPRPTYANFTLNGTGNAALCQSNVKRIFNFSHCTWGRCSFNGVFQPPVEGKFGAFSAFFFVMNFLNLTSSTLEESKEKLAQFCSKPWDEVKQSYSAIPEKYLAEYCFSGTYILTLLENGYNFTSDKWRDIEFLKKQLRPSGNKPEVEGISGAHSPEVEGISEAYRLEVEGISGAHSPEVEDISGAYSPEVEGISEAYRPEAEGISGAHSPEIGGSDAGWTLGYMLNLTNMIPAEAPDAPPLPHSGYVSIMVLFSLLLAALLLLLACKVFGRPTCAQNKYDSAVGIIKTLRTE